MNGAGDAARLARDVERIGVDFDGVVHDLHRRVCARIRDRHGIEYHPEDIDEWDPELPTGEMLTDEIEPLIESESALRRTEAVPGAPDGMRSLADAGYTLVMVTHRPASIHGPIRRWLDERSVPYHEFVADVPQNKGLVDIDLLIEDRPLNVRNALREGTHAIHFTGAWDGGERLSDARPNGRLADRDAAAEDDGIGVEPVLRRADSWSEVLHLIGV